ncbi:ribosomal protein S18-alanine N-acetyltransferase [Streptococcus halichoeri]|uniref:ribosomal protein S18-alanine N-acetyltransferase n=1 Tax=Streptococcus halichoeri TaxID=254785 RepID=UPI000DB394F4|nr:ribosomal protein S18-alanine N-acetyltransferase [Streptococcus halichoeri]PZO94114.1 MAG: ribosomal-protein-alanine N-acetyltransferase [Streptococcus pyogenes]
MKTIEEQAEILYQILKDANGQATWNKKQIESDLAAETVDILYAYDRQQLVGFMSLQQLAGEIELTNLAVKKAYQGQGIARRLLKHLSSYSQPIYLEVRKSNHIAQHLYQSIGFEAIGERKAYYHDPSEPAVIMKREGNDER